MARKAAPQLALNGANGMHIVRRPVASLTPYANNARLHSDAQIGQIMASIREFGFTNPVLTDGAGGIIAGHGRVVAAQKLGMTDVPCVDLAHLTPTQKRAYILADNQIALNAAWSPDLLRLELEELRLAEFDLSLTGFALAELDDLFGNGTESNGKGHGSLSEKFGVAPFSVLNAREGWWQDRKRAWLALGIQSELGRGAQPNTSARVGPDEEATYRTIGGRKPNAVPGGAPMPLDRAKARANATPGGAQMPAADYSKRQRGDGRGRAIG